MNREHEILGEFANDGFTLQEYADLTIELRFKGQSVAAFSQLGPTKENIQEACKRFMDRLKAEVGT